MVPAVRESWDSNWMDGSLHSNCSKDEVLDDADVHAFGSALEPLPTWDAVGRDVHDDDHLRSYHDTAARQSRQRLLPGHTMDPSPTPGLDTSSDDSIDLLTKRLSLVNDGKLCAQDEWAMRASNPDVVMGPLLSESSRRHPGWSERTDGRDTLSRMVRLHRTGSLEVEHTRRVSAPKHCGDEPGSNSAMRRARYSREHREGAFAAPAAARQGRARTPPTAVEAWASGQALDGAKRSRYYAEEERFWQERANGYVAGCDPPDNCRSRRVSPADAPTRRPQFRAIPIARGGGAIRKDHYGGHGISVSEVEHSLVHGEVSPVPEAVENDKFSDGDGCRGSGARTRAMNDESARNIGSIHSGDSGEGVDVPLSSSGLVQGGVRGRGGAGERRAGSMREEGVQEAGRAKNEHFSSERLLDCKEAHERTHCKSPPRDIRSGRHQQSRPQHQGLRPRNASKTAVQDPGRPMRARPDLRWEEAETRRGQGGQDRRQGGRRRRRQRQGSRRQEDWLRDAETILDGVLQSVEGDPSSNYAGPEVGTEDLLRTPQERRVAHLQQSLIDLCCKGVNHSRSLGDNITGCACGNKGNISSGGVKNNPAPFPSRVVPVQSRRSDQPSHRAGTQEERLFERQPREDSDHTRTTLEKQAEGIDRAGDGGDQPLWTSKRHRQTKHSALTSGARVSDLPDKFVTTTPEGYTCIAGRLFHNAATEGLEYRDDDDDESVGLEEDRRGGRREGHRDEQREEEDEETEETEEEGETAAAAAAAGRVADLSKRIALRCLHLEQECLRRERLQTRLFQEQIRGIRQAAQDMTRRVVRTERMRAKSRLEEARKVFDERERGLVAEGEKAKEGWKLERDALHAAATTAKSELDRVKRLSREATEVMREENVSALEKQKLELQRGWAEEKGGMRRAGEDSLRRVTEAKARAEEIAAQEARKTRDSLEAQIRSWKAKATTADKRAMEERDRRRAMEAGAKTALAEETGKARQAQETVLRDLTHKAETDREVHAQEIERLKEEHRAHVLRIHQEKSKKSDAAKRQWEREMKEVRAEAVAKADEAATRAIAERSEALRRLRLAHDVEMKKTGMDVLRLERELRRRQQGYGQPSGGMARSTHRFGPTSRPLPREIHSPASHDVETDEDKARLGVEDVEGSLFSHALSLSDVNNACSCNNPREGNTGKTRNEDASGIGVLSGVDAPVGAT